MKNKNSGSIFRLKYDMSHNAFPRFAERGEQGGYQQQDANECWVELLGMIKQKLMSKPSEGQAAASIVDQYFGLDFETETKCIESEEEPVVKSTEKFLQYSCYIDKEVKYLATFSSWLMVDQLQTSEEQLSL